MPPAAAFEKERNFAGTPRTPAGGLRPPAPLLIPPISKEDKAGTPALAGGLRPPADFVYPKERSGLVDSGKAGLTYENV